MTGGDDRCPICGGSTAHTLPVGLFTREGVPTHRRCGERERLLLMGEPLGPDEAVALPGQNRTLRTYALAWRQYKGRTTPGVLR